MPPIPSKLGRIESDAGYRYQLTADDLLWLARSVQFEGGDPEATIWTYTQLAALRRTSSFTTLVRGHSQPVNPKWESASAEKCRQHPDRCTPRQLARRRRARTITWEELRTDIKNLVVNWSQGRLSNGVPRAVNFADPQVSQDFLRRNGESRVIKKAGNWYIATARSLRWPDNFVKLKQPDDQTPSNSNNSSNSANGERRPQQQEETQERIQALTQGRTETPNIKFQYGIITTEEDASTKDPNVESGAGIDPSVANNIITSPYQKWYNQMDALRKITNLDLAQTVPVVEIFVRDGNDIINLNEKIFGASTYKNIFESEVEFREKTPERPIASIENFVVDIQSPSAGGGEGQISIAKLHLKIHNPNLINKFHKHGKYISYMMRASYAMRIRYGVSPKINSQTNDESIISQAFQWVEQDYYVAQHEITVNDDLTMNMVLTLMPGAEKLFNQVLIGESFPADATSVETAAVRSSQDQQTQTEVQALITAATNVSGTYGGMDSQKRPDGTLGSVLHGMTRNIDTVLRADGPQNIEVRRENLVNALRSIQSQLLTQRMESIFNDLAYLYTRPGDANLQYVAVNTGPLITRLVTPELSHIVSFMNENDLRLGTVFSTQIHESSTNTSPDNGPPPRTNIQIVFGNFNGQAGDWANKPISTFPLNVEEILNYTRQNRDVGRFQGSINNFINRMHRLISDSSNYIIDQTNPENRLATPIIKYLFYPHPEDPTSWIFYLYDQRERAVEFTETLHRIAQGDGELSRDQIKSLCEQYQIPWIEPGQDSSLIRTMQASTQADDQIASANLYAANSGFTTRQMDASNVPSGISREFISGLQMNLNEHIARTTVLLPLHVSLDYFIAVTTVLFGHIYIFFPLKQFAALFTAYELQHEVQKDHVSTKMTLNINVTRANQSAD